jgi:hypothetical protein
VDSVLPATLPSPVSGQDIPPLYRDVTSFRLPPPSQPSVAAQDFDWGQYYLEYPEEDCPSERHEPDPPASTMSTALADLDCFDHGGVDLEPPRSDVSPQVAPDSRTAPVKLHRRARPRLLSWPTAAIISVRGSAWPFKPSSLAAAMAVVLPLHHQSIPISQTTPPSDRQLSQGKSLKANHNHRSPRTRRRSEG